MIFFVSCNILSAAETLLLGSFNLLGKQWIAGTNATITIFTSLVDSEEYEGFRIQNESPFDK